VGRLGTNNSTPVVILNHFYWHYSYSLTKLKL
jgi:hypothetical protein